MKSGNFGITTFPRIEGHMYLSIYYVNQIKQCKYKGSNLDVNVMKAKNFYPMGEVQVDVLFRVTSEKIIHKEYLIYDGIAMFGSIGGSLGLFIGFSLFDSICLIIDSVLKIMKVT